VGITDGQSQYQPSCGPLLSAYLLIDDAQ